MIMVLPIRLLHKLQITRKQKFGLVAVFSLGFIIIAAAIVRLIQIKGQDRSDPVGLAVWGLVESTISVIVGSLPPLKAFIARKFGTSQDRPYSPYDRYGNKRSSANAKGYSSATRPQPFDVKRRDHGVA